MGYKRFYAQCAFRAFLKNGTLYKNRITDIACAGVSNAV